MTVICASAAALAMLVLAGNRSSAETSSQFVARDPKAQYGLIKAVLGPLVDKSDMYVEVDNTIDLDFCADVSAVGIETSEPASPSDRLFELAYEVLMYEHLGHFGYPARIWAESVRAHEQTSLDAISADGRGRKADDDTQRVTRLLQWSRMLNDYRLAERKNLPEVTVEGGCGDYDGVLTSFHTDPKNGRIFTTSLAQYRLCEAQHLQPTDLERCDHWREVTPDEQLELEGRHMLLVTWPTLPSILRPFDARQLEEGLHEVLLK